MTKPAEIGNKQMLRAVDALLQMESTAGTPSLLQSTEVVPVIDIRAAAIRPGVPRYIETLTSIAAAPTPSYLEIYTPPEGQYAELLAAEIQIEFGGAPPAAGQLLQLLHVLTDFLPNGSDHTVAVGGYLENNPLVIESGITIYRAPLAAASIGGSASAPWMATRGRLYGQNFFQPASDPLGLFADLGFYSSANVDQNFPANTNARLKAWVLEYPLGQVP